MMIAISSYMHERVSLIPVAYYPYLAYERGRCLNDYFVDDDKSSTAGSSTKGDRKVKEAKVFDAAKKA